MNESTTTQPLTEAEAILELAAAIQALTEANVKTTEILERIG